MPASTLSQAATKTRFRQWPNKPLPKRTPPPAGEASRGTSAWVSPPLRRGPSAAPARGRAGLGLGKVIAQALGRVAGRQQRYAELAQRRRGARGRRAHTAHLPAWARARQPARRSVLAMAAARTSCLDSSLPRRARGCRVLMRGRLPGSRSRARTLGTLYLRCQERFLILRRRGCACLARAKVPERDSAGQVRVVREPGSRADSPSSVCGRQSSRAKRACGTCEVATLNRAGQSPMPTNRRPARGPARRRPAPGGARTGTGRPGRRAPRAERREGARTARRPARRPPTPAPR